MTAFRDVPRRVSRFTTPITSVEPGTDPDDLRAIGDRLRGRSVVGLGEATHGTRECFRLKHRLVRLLVEDEDVRLVAMEASFPEAMALHDYVVHGTGEPRAAISGLEFWIWNTESVLDLVEWLREFNAGRPPDDRVRFFGIDVQFNRAAARALRAFLATADPDGLEMVRADLDTLAEANIVQGAGVDAALLRTADRTVDVLTDRLEARRDAQERASGPDAWRLARQHCRVLDRLVERCELLAAGEDDAAAERRERLLFENLEWCRSFADRDRVVLWSHNAHVRRTDPGVADSEPGQGVPEGAARPTLGGHLADAFGEGYFALGFTFDRGAFRAIPASMAEIEAAGGVSPARVTVDSLADRLSASPDAIPCDLDAEELAEPQLHQVLAGLAADDVFLDVRAAARDATVGPWVRAPHFHHSVGSLFPAETLETRCALSRLDPAFDGIIHIDDTSASVPLGDGQ